MCAKSLRRSSNPTIRDNVFINANLSKAETREAYELRCNRRLAAKQRQSQEGVEIVINSVSNQSLYKDRVIVNSHFHLQQADNNITTVLTTAGTSNDARLS